MAELYQDRTFQLDFRSVTYLLHMVSSPSALVLDLQKKATGDVWIGEFSSEKLEENSQKTGNFKKYSVFLQMLLAAIQGSNEAVELDLLSYQDLEQLKAKKPNQGKTQPQQGSQNKMYLMLNYVAEFDKVHYPLQLLLQEVPSAERQKQTIKRLRAEISMYQNESNIPRDLASENLDLKHEVDMYKMRIKKLEDSNNKLVALSSTLSKEVPEQKIVVVPQNVKEKTFEKEYNETKCLLQTLQNQLNLCKSKLEMKEQQNKDLKEQLQKLHDEITDNSESREVKYEKDIRKMQQKLCKQFNDQLKSVSKQTQDLIHQLKKTKQESKKQKSRITELEKELSMMVKMNLSRQKLSVGGGASIHNNAKRSSTPHSQERSFERTKPDQPHLQSKLNLSKNSSTHYNRSKSKSKLKSNPKRETSSRRKSVMDSDTESSRLRRMSNRNVSPYRATEGIKRTPSNKSFKNLSPKSNRSSKSQSKKNNQSLNSSQIFTESEHNFKTTFASDSEDDNKISETVEMLRKNRQERLKKGYNEKTEKPRNTNTSAANSRQAREAGVEKQIMNIAEMLKQSRKELVD